MSDLPVIRGDERLAAALAALAVARGALADEFALQVYLDALADLDISLLERACFALAREPRAEFESALPPVSTVRARVSQLQRVESERAQAARLLPMPPKSDEDGPRYFCLDCFDESSGWRIFLCQGGQMCGRTVAHTAHPFTKRCHCWQRNPVVAERKRRLQVSR